MASLTIKGIPDDLLVRLRERAEADRRSLNREVIHLLGEGLARPAGSPRERMERQVEAWRRLAGRWSSDRSLEAETAEILDARTPGRESRP
jgi:plasmid stability protein